jgi:diguanylate cyclase (GGDEF)-like protein
MNRLIFERQVRSVIETDPEPGAAGRAMLYIDVDRLQFINDAFGFHAGDEVIERVAQLIRERVGREGIASRLGGDRFAIFMTACGEEQARAVATELLTAISSLGYMNGADAVPVSISIGLAMPGPAQRDFGHLIAAAELACKRAQQQGRNRLDIYAYGEATSPGHEGELLAAAALKQALQSNDFRLQAQPIVDLYNDPGKVLGYEVLVRMRDTSGALISPEKFIVAAERYGLMPALDKWVLTATVKALRAHKDQLRELPLGIAVNVSAQSLMNSDFAALVLAELTASGLPPELFCFELKESAAVNQLAAAEKFIKTVTEIGCHISLDDFGSGLTSLSHLKRLKVSYLKIDGSLIRRVIDDIHAESLVRGLAKAAQTLGVLTVAEHVESAALAEKLQQLEVDLAQGYHYGRPMPLIRAIANVGVAAPAVSTA